MTNIEKELLIKVEEARKIVESVDMSLQQVQEKLGYEVASELAKKFDDVTQDRFEFNLSID